MSIDWIGCPPDWILKHSPQGMVDAIAATLPEEFANLSLLNLQHCAERMERLSNPALPTSSLQMLYTQRWYAFLLSLLLCLDGAVALLVAYVVYAGTQIGPIRPPDPGGTSRLSLPTSERVDSGEVLLSSQKVWQNAARALRYHREPMQEKGHSTPDDASLGRR